MAWSSLISCPAAWPVCILLSQIDRFCFKAQLIITRLLREGRILHFFQHGTKGYAIPEIGDNSLWAL